MKEKRIVPKVCFSFAELAVRLTREGGRHEGQKLMSVLLDTSSDPEELRPHVRRVEKLEVLSY